MYLAEQTQIANSNFSLPMAYHFESLLDSAVLIQSLQDFINHHPVLRSVIVEEQGEVFFEVQEQINLNCKVLKTNLMSAVGNYQEDTKLGFNLSTGPLFRIKIYEIDGLYTVLYINFHHLVFDGHSSRLFMRELEKRYLGNIHQEEITLKGNRKSKSAIPIGPKLIEELKALYKFPIPVLDIPKDNFYSNDESRTVKSIEFQFSSEHLEKAQDKCQELGITLYHFYLFAFSVILSRHSGQKEFLIGTPVLGRNSKEELNEIGFYANTVLLPIGLDHEQTLAEGLKYSALVINNVLKYKKVPYGELVKSIGNNSHYQSFFMYQDFSSQKQSFSGIHYTRTHLCSGTSHSEIDLWLTKYDGVIKGGLHYREDCFSPQSIKRIQESFYLILDQLCEKTETSIKSLPNITKLNQDSLVERFSNYKEESLIGFLSSFKKQVELSPDKTAIINPDQLMTYQQLDGESDRLASYLL
jgi:hypothetical protein